MSVGSHPSSMSSIRGACRACGVDMEATLQHVSNVKKKQELLEEKLEVEKEILKKDKQNFRRRVKAAKLSAGNSRKEAEAVQAESKEALDLANRRQREYEQYTKQTKERYEAMEAEHKTEVEKMKGRIRTLESLQEAKEKDKRDLNGDLQTKLEESESQVKALQNQLESKQLALESFEMQLLELERDRDEGAETPAACVNCTRLDVQLKEIQARLGDSEDKNKLLSERLLRITDENSKLSSELLGKESTIESSHEAVTKLSTNLESLTLSKTAAEEERDELLKRIDQVLTDNEELHKRIAEAAEKQPESVAISSSQANGESGHVPWTPPAGHTFEMEFEWHGDVHTGIYTGWLSESKIPDGPGTLRYEDGNVYDGHWKNGQRHGNAGIFATLEGDIYRGGWFEDEHHGSDCVFVWSDGRVYQGAYRHGLRQGRAVMTWPHGATFRGVYVDDKRNGEGSYLYSDGRCYAGTYRDERPHGYGTLTAADGETVIYQGKWELGEFIGP